MSRRLSELGAGAMAKTLLVSDALRIVALLAFAFATSFAVALAAFWAARVIRSIAAPVYSTWLNTNVDDSRVRATVLSMTNVFGSAGEWGGGPALGIVGNAFGIRVARSLRARPCSLRRWRSTRAPSGTTAASPSSATSCRHL
jgi:hypothetical protein